MIALIAIAVFAAACWANARLNARFGYDALVSEYDYNAWRDRPLDDDTGER